MFHLWLCCRCYNGHILYRDIDLKQCGFDHGSEFTLADPSSVDPAFFPDSMCPPPVTGSGLLLASIDANDGFALLPVFRPEIDFMASRDSVPLGCEWRTSAIWKLEQGVALPFVVLKVWPRSLLAKSVLARLCLLKMVDNLFYFVRIVGCSFDMINGLVIEACHSFDLSEGSLLSIGFRSE